jgi:hypothetical protein
MEYKKYFIDDNPNGYRCREKWLRTNNDDLYNKIIDWTSHISDILFIERIWYFINEKQDIIKCSCGNPTKYQNSLVLGFREFCSRDCPHKILVGLERNKKTCQEKYGVDYSQQNVEIKEKRNKNIYDKYGVTSTAKLGWVKEKYKKTCQEKYGVDSHTKNDIIKSKIRDTFKKNYGVDNVFKSDKIKESIKEYSIKNHRLLPI